MGETVFFSFLEIGSNPLSVWYKGLVMMVVDSIHDDDDDGNGTYT